MATKLVSRDRFASFDVQMETRAALAAALEKNQLPANFGDIHGLVVTEKNTFINIQAASEFEEVDCDRDLVDSPSPILSRRDRKQTEGMILSSGKERRYSCLIGARSRRSSCPPKMVDEFNYCLPKLVVKVDEESVHVVAPVTPDVGFKSRRHYSIDMMSSHYTCRAPSFTSPLSVKPIDETCTTLPSTPTMEFDKTTVMLRNVPYSESQLGVLNMIEEHGFVGCFNFFYAPLDFSTGNNLGYAFINLPDKEDVDKFFALFDGLRLDRDGWSQKDLQVCWAKVQGAEPNVEHYRNSPVNDMPENFRPMIFDCGNQIPFPRPDENLARRPLPSVYSGNRATNRPRFASAHLPGTFPQRRKVSFHRPPQAL